MDGGSYESVLSKKLKVRPISKINKLCNISPEDFVKNTRKSLKLKVSDHDNLESIPYKKVKVECDEEPTARQPIFETQNTLNETVFKVTELPNISTNDLIANIPNKIDIDISDDGLFESTQYGKIKIERFDSTTEQSDIQTQNTLNKILVSKVTEVPNVTNIESFITNVSKEIKADILENKSVQSTQYDEIKVEIHEDFTADQAFLETQVELNRIKSTEDFNPNKITTKLVKDICFENIECVGGVNIEDTIIGQPVAQEQDVSNKIVTPKDAELHNVIDTENCFLDIRKKLKTIYLYPKAFKHSRSEAVKEDHNIYSEIFTSNVSILHHKINDNGILANIRKELKTTFNSALECSHSKAVDQNIACVMLVANEQSTLNDVLNLQCDELSNEANYDRCNSNILKEGVTELSDCTQHEEVKSEYPIDFSVETSIIKVEDTSDETIRLHTEVDVKDFITSSNKSTFNPPCGQQCSCSRSSLQQYFYANGGPFPCPHCEKVYFKRGSLTKHLTIHTRAVKCLDYSRSFSNESKPSIHSCFDEKLIPLKCSCCNKTYSNSATFRAHMVNHANNSTFHCPQCSEIIVSLSNFRNHLICHSSRRSLQCCNVTFPNSSIFMVHLITHMADGYKKCPDCKKIFPNCAALKKHRLVHNDQRPFTCPYCKETVISFSSFNKHLLKHAEEQRTCELCGKTFASAIYLRKHLQVHVHGHFV